MTRMTCPCTNGRCSRCEGRGRHRSGSPCRRCKATGECPICNGTGAFDAEPAPFFDTSKGAD